jgi:hypothetical protein
MNKNTPVSFTLIYITDLHDQVCSNPASYNGGGGLKYGSITNNYVRDFSRFTSVTLIQSRVS